MPETLKEIHGVQGAPPGPERKELESRGQGGENQETGGFERDLFTGKQDQGNHREAEHGQGMGIRRRGKSYLVSLNCLMKQGYLMRQKKLHDMYWDK
jgi:hypothetical protein